MAREQSKSFKGMGRRAGALWDVPAGSAGAMGAGIGIAIGTLGIGVGVAMQSASRSAW